VGRGTPRTTKQKKKDDKRLITSTKEKPATGREKADMENYRTHTKKTEERSELGRKGL